MKLIRFLGPIILAVTAFILMKLMSGSWWTAFLDLPNFLIVGVFPLIYQLILFGAKNFKNAFSAPLKKECSAAEASGALSFFKAYSKAVWIFSAAATLIGIVSMLKNLDDPKWIGPNMAVALISFLYAALINLFLILPYMSIAKQCLTESEIQSMTGSMVKTSVRKNGTMQFFFSIILVVFVFIHVTWISGGALLTLYDLPSLLITGIVPLLYQLMLCGGKNFQNAFSAPFKKECSAVELSKALDFFKAYNKSVWTFSMAAVGISLIAVFTYLDIPVAVGPNLALALLSFLYAALIYLILILPCAAIAKQRFTEIDVD